MNEKEYNVKRAETDLADAESKWREADRSLALGRKKADARIRQTEAETSSDVARLEEELVRAVEKGGAITLETLTELLKLLSVKTDYYFHVEVAILPTSSAILKTIDNERDAQETIRRLKAKP